MPHKYPAIKGLSWHREQFYSFFIPMDWHQFHWADGRQGVIYGPVATDPLTIFAVDVHDLGTTLTKNDLHLLAEGFFESILKLPQVNLELRDSKTAGSLLELEAKYTFNEPDGSRKRWVRLFYHETRQITMAAQGATPEKYDYWLPWFFEAMMTAKIHSQRPEREFPE